MDDPIAFIIMFGVPAYGVLQWYLAHTLDGGWRLAALAPLLVMVPVVLHAAAAFMGQSNLWPLLLILTAPPAFIYLLAVAGAHRLFAR